MATIVRTKEGNWRAQVRRKGKYASRTFRLKGLASEWVAETERLIDIGCEPSSRKIGTPRTMADLVDLHISDLQEVGKPIRRSKQVVLEALKRDIGATRISVLSDKCELASVSPAPRPSGRTELTPLIESSGAVQLEILAGVEMALLIKMVVDG